MTFKGWWQTSTAICGQCSLEGSQERWEKHLKSSVPAPKNACKETEKTTFRSPKSCFICNWKGLPLQWRFGQLEKHVKSSLPGPKNVSGRENKKQLFGAWKVVFFNLQLEGSPFAVALWAAGKGTWEAQCLLPRVSEENKKNSFSGTEKLFF